MLIAALVVEEQQHLDSALPCILHTDAHGVPASINRQHDGLLVVVGQLQRA
jgi:hypothetical protein